MQIENRHYWGVSPTASKKQLYSESSSRILGYSEPLEIATLQLEIAGLRFYSMQSNSRCQLCLYVVAYERRSHWMVDK